MARVPKTIYRRLPASAKRAVKRAIKSTRRRSTSRRRRY